MCVCNRDCFNCVYDDCIDNSEDYTNAKLDIELDLYAKRESDYFKRTQMHIYNVSEKGKARMNRYNHSEKGKARSKKFENTEHRKAYRRDWAKKRYQANKLKKEQVC